MNVLLIIPAYNEEDNIVRVCSELKEKYSQYDFIVIDDGSTDSTLDLCRHYNFPVISLPINLGLAGAFQTGMKYAYRNGYDCAVQFDADGQHLPEYIDLMLKELKNGNDVVIGSRFVNKRKPFSLRMLGSYLIAFTMKLTTGFVIKDPTSGMRVYNRPILRLCAEQINYGPEPDTLAYLLKKKMRIKEVQVTMNERIAGESYLNLSRSIMYMLRMMISLVFIQNFRE
jgi:glycosyltransferase involved in cell wall biosynthesis